ncbi:peptidyl-prolyl cis-trans isomerase C [Tepidamorphus gemmatus]|uniref:Parvulin-like PPIase n=1 Tax=Tepidamorphus gemmatus TaxID=747076 RepID=A0A4R3M2N9_9HYPH|nr:peptidylprolyl isomerase [Tepidamorphus gemmatus]TCT05405.1 peptidyl-prolyl cis-trans isomerase C [Tepidamorphus gemmatus]
MRLFDVSDRRAAPSPPAVRVNGTEISRDEIAREIQHHPATSPGAAREAAVRALVVRRLLLDEARRLGLQAECEVETDADGRRETPEEALVRRLIETQLRVPTPTEAECRRFYDARPHRFRTPDLHEAAHILFSAARDNAQAVSAAEAAASGVIAVLRGEPGRFAEFAAALSACPSAGVGGQLGPIASGQTTPEFEAALMTMTPGTICDKPIRTRYGVHVVRLDRRIAGCRLPFEAVRCEIADYLADAVFHRAVYQYLAILAGRAEIEGITLVTSDGLLVQ